MESQLIEIISKSFLKEYTKYVTTSRVLPHLDLKPVHKRLVWSLIQLGHRSGKGSFRKSMSVVGNTLQYHPHGDTSCYDALCTLVNSPNALVSGRGSFGSGYGDPPASARYTEVRTSELFEHLFDDTSIKIGDFIPNYDNTTKEPVYIQTKLPLSPLIGCSGIGVGISTSMPAMSVATVKSKLLNRNSKIEYSYGGTVLGSRVYPKLEVIDDYLKITELPYGCSLGLLQTSKLLYELQSAKCIEIIDESDIKSISIRIKAPESIQALILNSCSKPIITNFNYYWNKVKYKEEDYYTDWMVERKKYIERREYYLRAKSWVTQLSDLCLTLLSSRPSETWPGMAKTLYEERVTMVPQKALEFIPKSDEFEDYIQNKPIKSVKYKGLTEPKFSSLSPDEVSEIFTKEVESIDDKLFSKPSKPIKSIPKAKFTSLVKRYVTLKDNGIEVKFTKTPRVINWEITDTVSVIYSNLKVESLDSMFFGVKESPDQIKVVGFSVPDKPTVVVTESDKIISLIRLSAISEPIKQAFPATKMLIGDKEVVVARGMFYEKSSWKILET